MMRTDVNLSSESYFENYAEFFSLEIEEQYKRREGGRELLERKYLTSNDDHTSVLLITNS